MKPGLGDIEFAYKLCRSRAQTPALLANGSLPLYLPLRRRPFRFLDGIDWDRSLADQFKDRGLTPPPEKA